MTAPPAANDPRIANLESDLRRLKRLVPILIIGFGLLLLWQLVPGPDVLEARQVVVRDRQGMPRVVMAMWEDDKPTVRLNDSAGKARAMWFLNPDRGGALRFTDPSGYNRIQMRLGSDGTPEVWLGNEGGRTRTTLGIVDGDAPGLILTGEDLRWLWVAPPRTR